MKTNKFKASVVFRNEDKTASATSYNSVIECIKPVEVRPHYKMEEDFFEVSNACFILYKKDNPGLMCNSQGIHYVRKKSCLYTFTVFLEDRNDVLSNEIVIKNTLPVGLKMTRMYDEDEEAYGFTGLNVMLFVQAPKYMQDTCVA